MGKSLICRTEPYLCNLSGERWIAQLFIVCWNFKWRCIPSVDFERSWVLNKDTPNKNICCSHFWAECFLPLTRNEEQKAAETLRITANLNSDKFLIKRQNDKNWYSQVVFIPSESAKQAPCLLSWHLCRKHKVQHHLCGNSYLDGQLILCLCTANLRF